MAVPGAPDMSGALVLLKIAGFVTLLLWGTHMVTSGVLRAFGAQLRQRIGSALSSIPKAFLSGVAVTLALQSSTATGLMASSFAAHGVLAAVPGFVLMLGANVGTALVTQIFAFPAVVLAAPLFLMGYLCFRNSASTRWKDLGRALIGVGLMFLSLHELVNTFKPLGQLELFQMVLGALDGQAVLALLIGVGAAWICHSSVAVVLLVLSLAAAGVLPLEAGLAMVLGANLGGAIPPAFEVEGPVARRLPLGNLMVRAVGVSIGMVALPWGVSLLEAWGHTQPRALVDAHVAFNLALAFLALPFARPASVLLVKLLPDPPVPEDPSQPRYLDPTLLGQPHLALSNIEREALRLSDSLGTQLVHARRAIETGSVDDIEQAGKLGDVVTSLGRFIRQHLTRLPTDKLSSEEQRRVHELMTFAINLEHAADLIPHHLIEPLAQRSEEGDILDAASKKQLGLVMVELQEGLGLAVAVLLRNDLKAAKAMVDKKVALRALEHKWHQEADVKSAWPGARSGAIEVDVMLKALRECRRIFGHLGALAYHVLEDAGQLRSRVTEGDGS